MAARLCTSFLPSLITLNHRRFLTSKTLLKLKDKWQHLEFVENLQKILMRYESEKISASEDDDSSDVSGRSRSSSGASIVRLESGIYQITAQKRGSNLSLHSNGSETRNDEIVIAKESRQNGMSYGEVCVDRIVTNGDLEVESEIKQVKESGDSDSPIKTKRFCEDRAKFRKIQVGRDMSEQNDECLEAEQNERVNEQSNDCVEKRENGIDMQMDSFDRQSGIGQTDKEVKNGNENVKLDDEVVSGNGDGTSSPVDEGKMLLSEVLYSGQSEKQSSEVSETEDFKEHVPKSTVMDDDKLQTLSTCDEHEFESIPPDLHHDSVSAECTLSIEEGSVSVPEKKSKVEINPIIDVDDIFADAVPTPKKKKSRKKNKLKSEVEKIGEKPVENEGKEAVKDVHTTRQKISATNMESVSENKRKTDEEIMSLETKEYENSNLSADVNLSKKDISEEVLTESIHKNDIIPSKERTQVVCGNIPSEKGEKVMHSSVELSAEKHEVKSFSIEDTRQDTICSNSENEETQVHVLKKSFSESDMKHDVHDELTTSPPSDLIMDNSGGGTEPHNLVVSVEQSEGMAQKPGVIQADVVNRLSELHVTEEEGDNDDGAYKEVIGYHVENSLPEEIMEGGHNREISGAEERGRQALELGDQMPSMEETGKEGGDLKKIGKNLSLHEMKFLCPRPERSAWGV